jgi:hypothetical protein
MRENRAGKNQQVEILDSQTLDDYGSAREYNPEHLSGAQLAFKEKNRRLQNLGVSRGMSPAYTLLYINRKHSWEWFTIPWGKYGDLETELMAVHYPERTIWPTEYWALVRMLAAARLAGRKFEMPTCVDPADLDVIVVDEGEESLRSIEVAIEPGEVAKLIARCCGGVGK